MLWAIWDHLYNLKNVKNTHGGMFLLVKLQALEAATRGVLLKKVFLEMSQNSQENTCAKASLLIKLKAFSEHLRTTALSWFE